MATKQANEPAQKIKPKPSCSRRSARTASPASEKPAQRDLEIITEESTFDEAYNLGWELHFQFRAKSKMEKQRYQNHLQLIIGNKRLDEITPLLVERIKIQLLKSNRSPATVVLILKTIRETYNLLIRWQLFNYNPAQKLNVPQRDNKRHRFLEKEEADLLLKELKDHSLQTWQIALLSLSTGARAGEVFNLTGNRIDLYNKSMRIVDSKTEKNRTVYLPKVAVQMLSDMELKKNFPVFMNRNGQKINTISKTFPRIVDMIGLNDGVTDPRDKVVFHTLRHTFASWLVQSGVQLHIVGELLGHSTLEMTRRYSHLTPEIKSAAVGTIDSYL